MKTADNQRYGALTRTFVFTTVWLFFFCMHAFAAPFSGQFSFTQPNGVAINLWGEGDEFHAVFETLDGYAVLFDQQSQAYQYAKLSADGSELQATGAWVGKDNPQTLGLPKHLRISTAAMQTKALARRQQWEGLMDIQARWKALKAERASIEQAVLAQKKSGGGVVLSPPSSTTTGTKVGLTLLVDFSDAPATIPQAEIVNFCNGTNYTGYGNRGSVWQYFYDVSKGLLNYTNVVTVYVRVPYPKTYYNDTAVDCGIEGRKLVTDALNALKALPNYTAEILPTLSGLSADSASRVSACNVFFAGANSGVWSYGLWPNSYALASVVDLGNGKYVSRYQISNIGSSLGIGTFCHENGHMLCGYPDIYDYTYNSRGGAGQFCLMNSGGAVQICAYLKRASGWATTVELDSTSNMMASVSSSGADFNKFYRYQKPGVSTEYFLVENRQKSGYDASLPAAGIAIWHIDEYGNHDNANTNANASHLNYEVSLMQADNLWHFQKDVNSGDAQDLFYAGNTASSYTGLFNDNSGPNARWWDGSLSGVNFHDFSVSGPTMTFAVGLTTAMLTTQVYPPNSGYVTGGGSYVVESTAVLTAVPSNSWVFINWNDGVTNATRVVTVPLGGAVYTANFGQLVQIDGAATPSYAGVVSGGGTYLVGQTTWLTATAANGWRFTRWSDGAVDNPRTIVAMTGGTTCTAVFAQSSMVAVEANPPNGGRVTGSGVYWPGGSAQLSATASNQWRFINWSDGDTNALRTVIVPSGGASFIANFSPVGTVSVVANPSKNGSVTGGGVYFVGSNATVTATAAPGGAFLNWNGSVTNNPWAFSVASGTTVCTANFAKLSTVIALPSTSRGGTVTGGGTYPTGVNVPLSALSSTGWLFTCWNDGALTSSRTISVPSNDTTYTAIFTYPPQSYTLGNALNATGLPWQTGGNADWFSTSAISRDGSSLQSGVIAGGQQSWVQTVVSGPGSMLFWWKTAAEVSDALQFTINGQVQARIGGVAGWQQYAVFLGSTNTSVLRWTFKKDTFTGTGIGWLDQVAWLPCPYAAGVPQLFFQEPGGMVASWVVSSTGSFQFARILATTGGWSLKAAGDVDGDGVSDILFQTSAGDIDGWFLNADGSARGDHFALNSAGWEVKAVGDYEGIGRAQVFLQNSSGSTVYWRLETNGAFLANISLGAMAGWKLRGAGDLDGDHKAEVFWQNAAGIVAIWFHNPDGSIRGAIPFGGTGEWALSGVTDVDGDGICDLLWQTPDTRTGGWFMRTNGTARAASFWWPTGGWKLKAAGR